MLKRFDTNFPLIAILSKTNPTIITNNDYAYFVYEYKSFIEKELKKRNPFLYYLSTNEDIPFVYIITVFLSILMLFWNISKAPLNQFLVIVSVLFIITPIILSIISYYFWLKTKIYYLNENVEKNELYSNSLLCSRELISFFTKLYALSGFSSGTIRLIKHTVSSRVLPPMEFLLVTDGTYSFYLLRLK